MKHKIFLLAVFGGISIFFTMVAISGQQKINELTTSSFSNLTLRIVLSQQDFLPYEPIHLNISLSNETTVPIIGHSELGFGEHHIKLLLTNEKGETIEVSDLSPVKCKCGKPKDVHVLPGQKFQKSGFFYNMPKAFLTAGTYHLQAVFQDAKHQSDIKSKPVTIRIIEPSGVELDAFNFLKDKMEKNGFLFSGMGSFEVYNDLATRFNGSLYSDYGAFIVSGKYIAAGDYEKAESLLRRGTKRENFTFKEAALKSLNHIKELKAKNNQQ